MAQASILQQVFSLDKRSLGLFRIGMGITLILDLLIRAGDMRAHYTDAGVAPREYFSVFDPQSHYFSLFDWFPGETGVTLLFSLMGILATALIMGWHTRWVTLACWILWTSLHHRNPLVLDGGDNMIRVFLFWGMFLPWGERFSLEGVGGENRKGPLVTGIIPAAVILQFIMIYVFTALWKSGPEWHHSGNALYQALSLDTYSRPLGRWMQSWDPSVLRILTHFTLWFELLAPFLVLIPWRQTFFRYLTVGIFIFFQIMLALVFSLGLFPLISCVVMLAFLPAHFWDQLWGMKEKQVADFIPRSMGAKVGLGLIVVLLTYMLAINVMKDPRVAHDPGDFAVPAKWIGMDQKWSMFGPSPDPEDGWFIVEGHLENGKSLDFLPWVVGSGDPKPVSFQKPDDVRRTYGSARWQSFLVNMWFRANQDVRGYFLSWLCQKWNQDAPGDQVIESLKLIYMLEETGEWEEKEPVEVVLYKHFDCGYLTPWR